MGSLWLGEARGAWTRRVNPPERTNNSGVDTGKFSWAIRVQVEDGQVKSWNWFEDSYAVSKAYHVK